MTWDLWDCTLSCEPYYIVSKIFKTKSLIQLLFLHQILSPIVWITSIMSLTNESTCNVTFFNNSCDIAFRNVSTITEEYQSAASDQKSIKMATSTRFVITIVAHTHCVSSSFIPMWNMTVFKMAVVEQCSQSHNILTLRFPSYNTFKVQIQSAQDYHYQPTKYGHSLAPHICQPERITIFFSMTLWDSGSCPTLHVLY